MYNLYVYQVKSFAENFEDVRSKYDSQRFVEELSVDDLMAMPALDPCEDARMGDALREVKRVLK